MKGVLSSHSRWILPLAALLVFALAAHSGPAETSLTQMELNQLRSLALKPEMQSSLDAKSAAAKDPRVARFGKTLFHDPRFSGRLNDGDNDGSPHTLGRKGEWGKVSCAGCHDPARGFSDSRTLGGQISLAAGWGKRRTPSLFDVGQVPHLMWDGRHDSLEAQIISVIESPVEMNSSRLFFAQQLYRNHKQEYEALFGPMPPLLDFKRFPELKPELVGCRHRNDRIYEPCEGPQRGGPGDRAEFDRMKPRDQALVNEVVLNAGRAIAAFERGLTCGPSRFDGWVNGQTSALTQQEIRGAKLFVSKGKCIECHSGPMLSDQGFHNVGLAPKTVAVAFNDFGDRGAAEGIAKGFITLENKRTPASVRQMDRAKLEGAFKTPMLRCSSMRPSFFHTGQARTLEEVVEFFNRGGDAGGYPGKSEIRPLGLSRQEEADLVAFLKSLDGLNPVSD